eukprot:gene2062-4029_t
MIQFVTWKNAIILTIFFSNYCAKAINIALHAQVSPAEKVVGSVITTDGLKAAFQSRSDVQYVEIFYPFSYTKFFDISWDLILIEGWFPSISEFISLSRSNFPSTIIIFYCLDPTYPGLSLVRELDVDGYLTNSRIVQDYLDDFAPTKFVMLAADPLVMAPNITVARNWTAVYVGAGGGMINYKPVLLGMLQAALPFGLLLYGSHWNEVESLRHVWQGILPRYELSTAYSRAQLVIATTIESQANLGMINNRIFEALACGAVIISDDWPILREEFGDLLLYATHGDDVSVHIQYILEHPMEASIRREQARKLILHKHTWSHRVIEILDFFHNLHSTKSEPSTVIQVNRHEIHINNQVSYGCHCGRPLCPQLAWIVSNAIEIHSDYNFMKNRLILAMCKHYSIEIISETVWMDKKLYLNETFLATFDVLISVCTPFDNVDKSFTYLPTSIKVQKHSSNATQQSASQGLTQTPLLTQTHTTSFSSHIQRRGAFWFGFDASLLGGHGGDDNVTLVPVDRYEVIWFRDMWELELLQQQLQQQLQSSSYGVKEAVIIDPFRVQSWFSVGPAPPQTEQHHKQGPGWRQKSAVDATATATASTDVIIDDSKSANKTLSTVIFICFSSHMSLCTKAQRMQLNPCSDGGAAAGGGVDGVDVSCVLVLIGGDLRQWLSSSDSVVDSSDLTNMIHVANSGGSNSGGGGGSNVLTAISTSKHIYIMNPPDSPLDTLMSTVSDVLWPMAAAVASRASIHLLHYNTHLIQQTEIDYSNHDDLHMIRAIGHGVARLHGFAAARSKLLVESYSTLQPTREGDGVYRLYYTFENFILGIDGQCCFIYGNETLGCSIRNDVEVNIRITGVDKASNKYCSTDESSLERFTQAHSLGIFFEPTDKSIVFTVPL